MTRIATFLRKSPQSGIFVRVGKGLNFQWIPRRIKATGGLFRGSLRRLALHLLTPQTADVVGEWHQKLGGKLSVGAGTVLRGAALVAREPDGCAVTVGAGSNIGCSVYLERKYAAVRIGSRTQIGGGSVLSAADEIEIGDDVLVAFDVLIMDHDAHSLAFFKRQNDVCDWIQGKKDWTYVPTSRVRISDKTWVGARAILLKGVTIGEGAVVGAGSVVTKDVPPWTVVAGNPARVIRILSEEERRAK